MCIWLAFKSETLDVQLTRDEADFYASSVLVSGLDRLEPADKGFNGGTKELQVSRSAKWVGILDLTDLFPRALTFHIEPIGNIRDSLQRLIFDRY